MLLHLWMIRPLFVLEHSVVLDQRVSSFSISRIRELTSVQRKTSSVHVYMSTLFQREPVFYKKVKKLVF